MLESFTSLFLGPKVEDSEPKKKTKPVKKMDKKPLRTESLIKKSVGRPRKNPEVSSRNVKKSVGRPRKNPEVVKEPKKSVGRPRKIHTDMATSGSKSVRPLVKKAVGRPLGAKSKPLTTREKIVSFL
jgi:hypothetical protein